MDVEIKIICKDNKLMEQENLDIYALRQQELPRLGISFVGIARPFNIGTWFWVELFHQWEHKGACTQNNDNTKRSMLTIRLELHNTNQNKFTNKKKD